MYDISLKIFPMGDTLHFSTNALHGALKGRSQNRQGFLENF